MTLGCNKQQFKDLMSAIAAAIMDIPINNINNNNTAHNTQYTTHNKKTSPSSPSSPSSSIPYHWPWWYGGKLTPRIYWLSIILPT
jgi:hypothetical protein